MARPIAYDLTRLFVGALGRTPRGIDRVDISFARRLFDAPGRHVGLVPTWFRAGVVTGAAARAIAATVERRWCEAAPAAAHSAPLAALERWLAGHADAATPARPRPLDIPWPVGAMLARTGAAQLRPAAGAVPPGSLYLNIGQVLLGWPWCLGWLDQRPDVKAVFMLHDLIPLRFPEYSGPLLSRHHGRALATAARRATALLATSRASADDLRDGLKAFGRGDMPIHVVPLPVSPSLLAPAGPPRPAGATPYFVTLGILDQRKNHRLLLHVWRDMVQRSAGPVPRLVIVGAPGLRTAGLHDTIARSPGLSEAVRVVSDLPSPALRTVLSGARGLLMPSFTEGFGIPIIEARALGVPVVASDIPAHREVGGQDTTLLDPLDGPGWQRAIARLADGSARPAPPAAPPQDWDGYFRAVLPFLDSL